MEEKKKSKAGLIFAIIGIVVVVAAAAYGLYRFFAPDYLEDFEDDFDDDLKMISLTRMTRKRNNHYHCII